MQNTIKLTSKDNYLIKSTHALHIKKERDAQNRYLIEGLLLCREALAAGVPVCQAFTCESFLSKGEGRAFVNQLVEKEIPLYLLPESLLNYCANTESPQGILLTAEKSGMQISLLEEKIKESSLLLILDAVMDPGNLGTIIRTAKAGGMDALILLPGTVDLYNPKVIRSAMGAAFCRSGGFQIIEAASTQDVSRLLQIHNIKIFTTAADGESIYGNFELPEPLALVMGAEAAGVSSFWQRQADKVLSIPMPGGGESLNVSVASGILVYEILRRKLSGI